MRVADFGWQEYEITCPVRIFTVDIRKRRRKIAANRIPSQRVL